MNHLGLAMRAYVKLLAAVLILGLALIAILRPETLMRTHIQTHEGRLWLLLALVAHVSVAKLALPLSLFGIHAKIAAPVFVLLAAPYLLWSAFGHFVTDALTPAHKPETPPRRASPAPYGLPGRAAVALVAAARARKH